MKKVFFSAVFLYAAFVHAQVGVGTKTPTEKLDVNGTLRVQSLPNDGQANSIYTTGPDTNSGATPTGTFNAGRPLVSDANGVIGKINSADLVPNNLTSGFKLSDGTIDNTSTAMFVVKRFELIDDNPLTGDGKYAVNGYDTGMKVDDWQAIMSNASWKFLSGPAPGVSQYAINKAFNYRLQGSPGKNWTIVGDILNIQEKGFVDVLFIKAKYVAAEDRSQ